MDVAQHTPGGMATQTIRGTKGGTLAFDLARRYGWCYVDWNGHYIASGSRDLGAAETLGRQMHRLSMSIADLVDEYGPDWIAVEKPIHTGKFTSLDAAVKLYGYVGIAAMVAEIREVGFHQIPRSTCCKTVLGNGRAVKADGVRFVRANFEPLCNSDDQADAVLVALAAHQRRDSAKVAA